MSSGFITESEATEARRKRQEEWERVRKPSDPVERPEEPYDTRSLYERLQEQKNKRDLEYEEAHKFKNMIKGLNDDEIEFLDLVDRSKLAADRKKEIEDELELHDYRNRVATLQEKHLDERLQAEIHVNRPNKTPTTTTNRSSQQKLLKGVVVKKNETLKRKLNNDDAQERSNNDDAAADDNSDNNQIKRSKTEDNNDDDGAIQALAAPATGMECVAILPGLGCYNDSSSEENSSDTDDDELVDKTDFLGRKIVNKCKES